MESAFTTFNGDEMLFYGDQSAHYMQTIACSDTENAIVGVEIYTTTWNNTAPTELIFHLYDGNEHLGSQAVTHEYVGSEAFVVVPVEGEPRTCTNELRVYATWNESEPNTPISTATKVHTPSMYANGSLYKSTNEDWQTGYEQINYDLAFTVLEVPPLPPPTPIEYGLVLVLIAFMLYGTHTLIRTVVR